MSSMGAIIDLLNQDIRYIEGLKACMNCGVCTAICPAAEFYRYDPRMICDTVQSGDEAMIEELLSGETIWYCGECMSCRTRCPRGNTPGLLIMALRKVAQSSGKFVQSEKGRQQFALKRAIGHSILTTGYCVHPRLVNPENHPEQGPVWQWVYDNLPDVMVKMGANFEGDGPGALRHISQEVLEEIQNIFEVTGGIEFQQSVEQYSVAKARQMGLEADASGIENAYFTEVYSRNNSDHYHEE